MKLIWAIVQDEDADPLIDALTRRQFRLTRINTAGGFLRQGNATLVTAVDEGQVDTVMSIIAQNCQTRLKHVNPVAFGLDPGDFFVPEPITVEVGGATVFVMNIVDFRRL
jgi:uncharacterized protein YaaQ